MQYCSEIFIRKFLGRPNLTETEIMKQKMPPSLSPSPPPPPSPPTTARSFLSKQHNDRSLHSSSPSPTTRLRGSYKARESPKTPPESVVNGVVPVVSSKRAKSVPPDMKNNSKAKRGVVLSNKAKPNEEVVVLGSQKAVEEAKVVVGRFVRSQHGSVEQFARPRRRVIGDSGLSRRIEDEADGVVKRKEKELPEKLELSENLIKDLKSEVVALKAELDRVKGLNVELESKNKKLSEDLAAAEAKMVAAVGTSGKEAIGEHQSPKFKDIQKLIADKLERSKVKKEATPEAIFRKASSIPSPTATIHVNNESKSIERKSPPNQCLPPPPPPPLPPSMPSRPLAKLASAQKAPPLVELFHSLKNHDMKRDIKGPLNHPQPVAISAHSSIVGEIQNRSAHLLAIRVDIETKGEFINDLIKRVEDAAYMDIEEVLKFVDWLDGELSSLVDERAVLKHFKWPEKKADAMREAAVEYRELKLLEQEISSYKDDPDIPCGAALKKMASLLDKSELSIQRLIKLRNSVMRSYQAYNIPTAWMLDSGIMSKIKQASMTLAKMYMKRVTMELKSNRNTDRESSQDSLLLQGVHFAYRAHQFAGGLDSETLCAFEEIRQRVPGHLAAGSRELLAGIPMAIIMKSH
ncbi:protein CHUP1, chloroplastic isoform X2 [Arachis ipaensis]|uniref:protein CHUP1, chloroplastic isoform X2 n=1 Tax=Arachis ipaensis TaxID=130454 RepID=UPI0007AF4613|nr:protein CHUP1, chloroplastic isoform X2 [Arachis ipaensis]XP_025629617.1 protein CHUP1, chloroplastic isoform X2 [Arachis hypogaea]